MKQLPIILVILLICGAGYLRVQQPKDWNNLLESLKAPGVKGAPADSSDASDSSEAAGSTDTATTTGGGDTPAPKAVTKPKAATYITPDTKIYLHSGHVNEVAQPDQVVQHSLGPVEQTAAKVFVPPNPFPSQPDWTWTTSDGKVYQNVIIQKVEADQVSIFHNKGSAVISIDTLSTDIQRQLNYDPELAVEALAKRQNDQNASTTASEPAASGP